jgi:hypothetical protein
MTSSSGSTGQPLSGGGGSDRDLQSTPNRNRPLPTRSRRAADMAGSVL